MLTIKLAHDCLQVISTSICEDDFKNIVYLVKISTVIKLFSQDAQDIVPFKLCNEMECPCLNFRMKTRGLFFGEQDFLF